MSPITGRLATLWVPKLFSCPLPVAVVAGGLLDRDREAGLYSSNDSGRACCGRAESGRSSAYRCRGCCGGAPRPCPIHCSILKSWSGSEALTTKGDRDGKRTSWDLHQEEQLRSFLEAAPQQRLEWLEEAKRFVWEAGAWPDEETRTPGKQ